MVRRRFVVLAGVLAAFTVTLVSASPGLAIRHAVVTQLFGPKMVRAVAVERSGDQWNLDRGVITQVSSTQLTLLEADGRVQPIPLPGGPEPPEGPWTALAEALEGVRLA